MGESSRVRPELLAGDGSGRVHLPLGKLLGPAEAAVLLARYVGDVSGRVVVVDFNAVEYLSTTFIDTLIDRLLEGGAAAVELVETWRRVQPDVEAAAARATDPRVRLVPREHLVGLHQLTA